MRQSIAIETKVTSGRAAGKRACHKMRGGRPRAAQVEQANLSRGKTTTITAVLCEIQDMNRGMEEKWDRYTTQWFNFGQIVSLHNFTLLI